MRRVLRDAGKFSFEVIASMLADTRLRGSSLRSIGFRRTAEPMIRIVERARRAQRNARILSVDFRAAGRRSIHDGSRTARIFSPLPKPRAIQVRARSAEKCATDRTKFRAIWARQLGSGSRTRAGRETHCTVTNGPVPGHRCRPSGKLLGHRPKTKASPIESNAHRSKPFSIPITDSWPTYAGGTDAGNSRNSGKLCEDATGKPKLRAGTVFLHRDSPASFFFRS